MWGVLQALLACALWCVVCWWCWCRPRSRYHTLPPYCVIHTPPPVVDYVVVGAGPAGLAACRALLMRHHTQQQQRDEDKSDTQTTQLVVLLIECGDVAPTRGVRGAAAWLWRCVDWRRLLSFAPDMVDVPVAACVPGCARLSLRSAAAMNALTRSWGVADVCACVCDAGLLSRRPLRAMAACMRHTSNSRNNSNDNDNNSSADKKGDDDDEAKAVVARRRAHAEAWLAHTPYPRGCGMGGTSSLDWGLQLPSAFVHTTTHGTRGGDDEGSTAPQLPAASCTTTQRSPLSWAFAEAAAATAASDDEDEATARRRRRRGDGSNKGNTHTTATTTTMTTPAMTQLQCTPTPLRIDADGRRLPLASVLLQPQLRGGGVSADALAGLQVLPRHAVVNVTLQPCEHASSSSNNNDDDDAVNNSATTRRTTEDDAATTACSEAVAVQCRRVCAACCDDDGSTDGTRRECDARSCACRAGDERSSGEPISVRVRCGVVVAAGAVHTPHLLHRMCAHARDSALPAPAPSHVWLRDAVALPMMFAARHVITADACNVTSRVQAVLQWWLTQRGPYVGTLTDVLARMPLPHVSAHAELLLVLLPFGGRDARRYYACGWDRVLGVHGEAFTVLLVLHGVPGLQLPLCLHPPAQRSGGDDDGDEAVMRRQLPQRVLCHCATTEDDGNADDDKNKKNKDGTHSCASPSPRCVLTGEVAEQVQRAMCAGMQRCRALCATPPLCYLTSSHGEAVDCTLLAAAATTTASTISDNTRSHATEYATRALRLAQLLHTPAHKRTRRGNDELRVLQTWATTLTHTEVYMRAYTCQHAYWLGCGSGSATPFLQRSHDTHAACHTRDTHTRQRRQQQCTRDACVCRHACFVRGVRNVVVADVSAVASTTTPHALYAGSVATAMDCGHAAATALTASLSA